MQPMLQINAAHATAAMQTMVQRHSTSCNNCAYATTVLMLHCRPYASNGKCYCCVGVAGQTRLFSLGADRRLIEYDLTTCTAANTGLRTLSIRDCVAPGSTGSPCAMCFAPPMPYYSHSSTETLLLVAGESMMGSVAAATSVQNTVCGSPHHAQLLSKTPGVDRYRHA